MLKIALSGCSGRMGRVISDIVSSRDGMETVSYTHLTLPTT